jgi:hypothetical protein
VPPHDGGGHPESEDEVLPRRRIKIPRRKGAPLIGRRGTAFASQMSAAEIGNPSRLTPDTAGVTAGLGASQGTTVLLVSIRNIKYQFKKTRFHSYSLEFRFLQCSHILSRCIPEITPTLFSISNIALYFWL